MWALLVPFITVWPGAGETFDKFVVNSLRTFVWLQAGRGHQGRHQGRHPLLRLRHCDHCPRAHQSQASLIPLRLFKLVPDQIIFLVNIFLCTKVFRLKVYESHFFLLSKWIIAIQSLVQLINKFHGNFVIFYVGHKVVNVFEYFLPLLLLPQGIQDHVAVSHDDEGPGKDWQDFFNLAVFISTKGRPYLVTHK